MVCSSQRRTIATHVCVFPVPGGPWMRVSGRPVSVAARHAWRCDAFRPASAEEAAAETEVSSQTGSWAGGALMHSAEHSRSCAGVSRSLLKVSVSSATSIRRQDETDGPVTAR